MKNVKEFEKIYINSYKKKPKGNSYYLVSIRPTANSETFIAFYSLFTHFHEDKYEVRRISLVDHESVQHIFRSYYQNISFVDSAEELTSLLKIGGHSLIEENTMKSHWNEILAPKIVVKTNDKGFLDYSSIDLAVRSQTNPNFYS